ncbi:MAG TPA: hypothetical protein VFK33_00780 [Bacillales bacterium]|nr:hypothetical protein [Bacillales bacterium]
MSIENKVIKSYHNKNGNKVFVYENGTVYVEGVGKATDVGELDMKGFIETAMSLPSFWR